MGSSRKGRGGLGERWERVMRALEAVLPVYDRMNRVISLGRDRAYREEGITSAHLSGLILDAGCGPGIMSEIASKCISDIKGIVLLDPSTSYLRVARERLSAQNPYAIIGIFEALPFRLHSFDVALYGFSLRDSIDMVKAIEEARMVLRSGGRVVVVDLGKPNDLLKRWAIGLWWSVMVPIIALLLVGIKGRFYRELYMTYKRLPKNSELEQMFQAHFDDVIFRVRMGGGAVIITAVKLK